MNPSFQISENVSLASLTTLGIGGKARYFVKAETEQQVRDSTRFASENSLDLFVLGGGSNILVSDDGLDGVVLQIAIRGIAVSDSRVTAGAGEDWDAVVEYCVEKKFAGLECLSGIPGLVGGTPVQNVGAYGQEVADTIVEVRCLDRKNGEVVTLSNAECGFTYRRSIFNSTHRDRFIVLSVTFSLSAAGLPKLSYQDLAEYFGDRSPSLIAVRNAVLDIRRSKSMVIDERDPNSKSAGSFFKNPIVPKQKLNDLRASFDQLPYFEFGDMFKIPAAWLIENAGFEKGYSMGRVGISTKHTLALINLGGATSAELIVLKERIQIAVAEKFGLHLQPEPIFVGF